MIKEIRYDHDLHQKRTPEEVRLFGGSLCLIVGVSVKPLAYVMCDYTCYDRRNQCDNKICHDKHLLPCGSADYISIRKMANCVKDGKSSVCKMKYKKTLAFPANMCYNTTELNRKSDEGTK